MSKADKVLEKVAALPTMVSEDLLLNDAIPMEWKENEYQRALEEYASKPMPNVEEKMIQSGRRGRILGSLMGAIAGGLAGVGKPTWGKALRAAAVPMTLGAMAGGAFANKMGQWLGKISAELERDNIDEARRLVASSNFSNELKRVLYKEMTQAKRRDNMRREDKIERRHQEALYAQHAPKVNYNVHYNADQYPDDE